jgi:CheY-like chemotaxis protein
VVESSTRHGLAISKQLVDDDADSLVTYSSILATQGYHVLTVATAQEAFDLLATRRDQDRSFA